MRPYGSKQRSRIASTGTGSAVFGGACSCLPREKRDEQRSSEFRVLSCELEADKKGEKGESLRFSVLQTQNYELKTSTATLTTLDLDARVPPGGHCCWSGETGRRTGLKILYPQGCAGSIPASSTIFK